MQSHPYTKTAKRERGLQILSQSRRKRMVRTFLALVFLSQGVLFSLSFAYSGGLTQEDMLNLECLSAAYPCISGTEEDEKGLWILLANGKRALYAAKKENGDFEDVRLTLDTDIRSSMAQDYVLDPERVETHAGYAPGRWRPYSLFFALYGENAREVSHSLEKVAAFNSQFSFVPDAAMAFRKSVLLINELLLTQASLRPWLKNAGSFFWRRIAGEKVLSAHSFGIAFDIGVKQGAAYWRWSRFRPHPQQKTYPTDIVQAFEANGFIWGGKWHEYDIMHFEYRPELICKAQRKKQNLFPHLGAQ